MPRQETILLQRGVGMSLGNCINEPPTEPSEAWSTFVKAFLGNVLPILFFLPCCIVALAFAIGFLYWGVRTAYYLFW
jgi:hypothetical protein